MWTGRSGKLSAFAATAKATKNAAARIVRNIRVSVRKRVGTKLEPHRARAVRRSALEVEHRPRSVGRPQAVALPAGRGILDTAVDILGEEAHRIGNGEIDELAVDECENRAVQVTHHDRYGL